MYSLVDFSLDVLARLLQIFPDLYHNSWLASSADINRIPTLIQSIYIAGVPSIYSPSSRLFPSQTYANNPHSWNNSGPPLSWIDTDQHLYRFQLADPTSQQRTPSTISQ